MEKKLLLIEDDAGIRETITDYFMSVAPGGVLDNRGGRRQKRS